MGKTMHNDDAAVTPAQYADPEVFPVPSITDFGNFEDYIADTEEIYDRRQKKFMEMGPGHKGLPEQAERCAEAGRAMIMAGAALFGWHAGNIDEKKKALEYFDKCKKDAGLREKNLKRHYELMEKVLDPDSAELFHLEDLVLESANFLFRTHNTQMRYVGLYLKDPEYMTPELQAEKKASAEVAKGMKMIPKGHYFLPARPFPPVRIPEGQRVPYPPEPFQHWKNLPIEDFYFDTEHDEFALPKGYVSKDGTIDDQSVVWNWEDRTVTMKFAGGEPVTWPFWKAKDTFDTLKESDWCGEYYLRLYEQWLNDIEPPGLRD